ncbi:MAG: amidohydrolase family protein [Propionibacteriaceae bacterium]|jgi:N-acetylglucosamine-6-phosphate deacetylase|nr:amidohydrolase family protein [Propionibacteriaceae bacterium]
MTNLTTGDVTAHVELQSGGQLLIHATRALLPDASDMCEGWVKTVDGIVTAYGVGAAPGTPDIDWDGVLSPGFVDVHSHGGGGANFGDGIASARTVLATHRAHGTTTMIGSLVTQRIDELAAQLSQLTPLVRSKELAGVHLEGPWLAEKYHGAHPIARLRAPIAADIEQLLTVGNEQLPAAQQLVRLVTIAPELDGALAAIAQLVARRVTVAIGHTACDYDTACAAISLGATGATHLFNAMPELLHRAPGPALALWEHPQVWTELICDATHVSAALVAQVMRSKPTRCVLVSDAMAAAGAADGEYQLGELSVTVTAGISRVTGSAQIAGSTLTLDRAVRTAVAAGVPVALALRAATAHPATYLGLSGVGSLTVGNRANMVLLDDALLPQQVFIAS